MRVAVYVRVSTQRQAQTQTIEPQRERLYAHLHTQGWQLAPEAMFRDAGYSGAQLARPGLERLRDRVARAAVDRLLITAPDRLARKYVHHVLWLEARERDGCQVEVLDRPLSQDPHDPLVLQIRGAVSEYERSLIAERMRRGCQAKFRAGLLLPWTRAPYGYRLDPDRRRDPAGVRAESAEAAIVAERFASYLDAGHSLFGLAKALMAPQTPTPSGKKRWHHATIRGILRNPVDTGQVYAGRTRARPARTRHSAMTPIGRLATSYVLTPPEDWVLGAHTPPLVSQEQFALVPAKLSPNQQFATRNNKAHTSLLRALVSCGRCRAACWARTGRPAYGYDLCRGKMHPMHSGRDERCASRFIPAKPLDELGWRDLCEVLTHPEATARALQRAQGGDWLPQDLQARREQLRKGRVSLDQQLDRLTEAYLGGVIPLAEYQRRRQELEQRRQALDSQVQQLEARVDRQADLAALATSMADFCPRVRQGLAHATFSQQRHLVELLIDRVAVTNEEVEIRYVIPTTPKSEHVRFCHVRKNYFNPTPPTPDADQAWRRDGRLPTEQIKPLRPSWVDDDHRDWPLEAV